MTTYISTRQWWYAHTVVITALLLLLPPGRGVGTQTQTPDDLGLEMYDFLGWAAQNGLDFEDRFEVANISGVGRGMVAKQDFKSGDMLLAVPKNLLITPQTAQASEMGRMFRSERLPDCRTGTQDECNTLRRRAALAHPLASILHRLSHMPWRHLLSSDSRSFPSVSCTCAAVVVTAATTYRLLHIP